MCITRLTTGAKLAKENFFLNYYDQRDAPLYKMSDEKDEFVRNGYSGSSTIFFGGGASAIFTPGARGGIFRSSSRRPGRGGTSSTMVGGGAPAITTGTSRAAPSPLPCRRGPPAPAVRLLRRRRGAVALALALRGATRNQSNPLGAASSPTDVAHAHAPVIAWVWIRVWSSPG